VAGPDGIFLERRSVEFLRTRTAWFLWISLGEALSYAPLEESLRDGHNLMDPRCSHEPAYEEDAATDSEDL
jgi:hypothetical protein